MTTGGARKGAGRKPGSGRYGEKTVPVRVPVFLAPKLKELLAQLSVNRISSGQVLEEIGGIVSAHLIELFDAKNPATTPQEAPQEDGHQAETGTARPE